MRPSVRTLGGRCNGKIIIFFLMFEQLLALAATQLSFQCGTKSINQKIISTKLVFDFRKNILKSKLNSRLRNSN